MSKIFGGSSSSQKSYNTNKGLINSQFSGAAGSTGQSIGALQQLLGGDSSGFDAYKDALGFAGAAEEGSRGVTGNAAARGLLRSGSTGKALVNYDNMIKNQYSQNYMQNLMGTGQMGLGAGQLIASAGQESTGKSNKKNGLGGLIGGGLSLATGGFGG